MQSLPNKSSSLNKLQTAGHSLLEELCSTETRGFFYIATIVAFLLYAPRVRHIEAARVAKIPINGGVGGSCLLGNNVSIVADGAVAIGLLDPVEVELKHDLLVAVDSRHFSL